MNNVTNISNKITLVLLFLVMMSFQSVIGQEEATANFGTKTTYHNQLFFNRFLINPTFSLVRENKSYVNILHRNQYSTFEDNNQNYFIGFSNKINDHTALGLGVYSQWSGVVQEFGFNANYATSVQLGDKSSLTFGTNVTYFSDGLDRNRVVADENDPQLAQAQKESKIAIQPGVTLSIGKFDFSVYAQDLFKYNQSTNEFLTNFNDKSIKAALQYTHTMGTTRGLFANGRFTPMIQVARNSDNSFTYVGSMVLELPKYGWLQTTFDADYGLSAGFGFNLNDKMSLGYLMEKDVANIQADLGWNHELSVAYTFKNNKKTLADYVDNSQDSKVDAIIRNYEEQILKLMSAQEQQTKKSEIENGVDDTERVVPVKAKKGIPKKSRKTIERGAGSSGMAFNEPTEAIEDVNSLAYQNSLILDELIYRLDSLESTRNQEFERRFEDIVRVLKNEIQTAGTTKSNTAIAQKASFNNPNEVIASTKAEIKKVYAINNDHTSKTYEKLPIKVLNEADIVGVKTGFYVIANVYKTEKYLNAFMKNLQNRGLSPKKFYNKENGLFYVYLADYEVKQEAETAYVSNLNGKYNDEKWIMQVDTMNSTATAVNMYED
ncbi:PorP/SprF family type IX secretion system membrane protein [Cellulophaga baltica]|uniref:PorP/SprF family type IX secretion system membrane protein n=1 Tax=Cellulophaga baltica TaxID=76594 RepID=UPI002495096D|nr:type IX secretion system membrane protein PorP/SprF [Cellulophaga baltica]